MRPSNEGLFAAGRSAELVGEAPHVCRLPLLNEHGSRLTAQVDVPAPVVGGAGLRSGRLGDAPGGVGHHQPLHPAGQVA